MKISHFINAVSEKAVAAAIVQAEQKTTGKIRVFVSHHKIADPVTAARRHFDHSRLHHHPHRNGVLIFVAPRSHKFAVLGDEAIHQRCGEEFWQRLAAEMTEYFKKEQWEEALLHAIHRTGDALAEYFPAQDRPAAGQA